MERSFDVLDRMTGTNFYQMTWYSQKSWLPKQSLFMQWVRRCLKCAHLGTIHSWHPNGSIAHPGDCRQNVWHEKPASCNGYITADLAPLHMSLECCLSLLSGSMYGGVSFGYVLSLYAVLLIQCLLSECPGWCIVSSTMGNFTVVGLDPHWLHACHILCIPCSGG